MSEGLASRYASILARVRAAAAESGRPAPSILAVSKGQSADAILSLYSLGHRDFGENYAQELVEKAAELAKSCPEIRWHFIGHLQSNKVKAILPHVHSIHSVDRESLASEIHRRAEASGRERVNVFLEVNIDAEPSKTGLAPEAAVALAGGMSRYPRLHLEGLMAIPSAESGEAELRGSFRRLAELERQCRPATHGQLSMGMSGDFELAIREGSTLVRVGTALFGPRVARG